MAQIGNAQRRGAGHDRTSEGHDVGPCGEKMALSGFEKKINVCLRTQSGGKV
jgi:hypothetical protein